MATKTKPHKPAISDIEIEHIDVFGTRVHNLKNIDVRIPRNKLVVFTGISGSGKSSLAFDTIFAEGQRRYMESFSAFARQFVGGFERPDVDKITGLSPVISIEQKTTNKNPRSTVGTTTELYDFLRLFFARIGEAHSYVTGKKMTRFTEKQIIDTIQKDFLNKKIVLLAPVVKGRKGHYRELFANIKKQGFVKVRVDGVIFEIQPDMKVDRFKIHDIEVVIDRIKVSKDRARLAKSIETAMNMGNGLMMLMDYDKGTVRNFSKNLMCPDSGISYDVPSPNSFSFNSVYGACPTCKGLGFTYDIAMDLVIPDDTKTIKQVGVVPLGEVRDNYTFKKLKSIGRKYKFTFNTPLKEFSKKAMNMLLYGSEDGAGAEPEEDAEFYDRDYEGVANSILRSFRDTNSEKLRRWAEGFMEKGTCPTCDGMRLRKESLHFLINGANISELAQMDVVNLYAWLQKLNKKLNKKQQTIAKDLLKEIKVRLNFLLEVGLDYLSLDRPSRSLSGGESQRIRLATQIGSKLVGITYVLDEPSIGLHQRDNHRLINALKELVDLGNSVLVVEHDKDIMLASDYILDIGPGAGRKGGVIVSEGTPKQFWKSDSLTAKYLNGKIGIEVPTERREGNGKELILYGASGNNLDNLDVAFPLGKFICVTGVSGSGKSTLINETLYPILRKEFYRSYQNALDYKKIEGLEHLDKVIEINQSPIGRTPRSNPATYIGVFTDIRALFTKLPEAQIRGYKAGRFSFNVKGGRCETCQGGGMKVLEMNFLPDVYVECESCFGKRYNRETLEVRYKGKSISEVLNMTVADATRFFEAVPNIYRKIKTLLDVGLGYITLGQAATTLSGGEAQRVKLASELSKKDTGKTLYILDEPTTGLHFEDIRLLMMVIDKLVDKGNSVIIIEHNMDVIKRADHIIDLGPEGGRGGGKILVQGTPEQVARNKNSHTAKYLKLELK